MDNDELKTLLYQAAKIAVKEEGTDGCMVASWAEADKPTENGVMIVGKTERTIIACANIVDKLAITNGIAYQDILRYMRNVLRKIARERRKATPGEKMFEYSRLNINDGQETNDDATGK